MARILELLRREQRWWPGEIALRLGGLALLGASWALACLTIRMVRQPPPHQSRPLEFLAAAAVFLCLSAGLALALEGTGLFRKVPLPPRAMLP
jgi:hypothetical protein